MRLGMVAVLYTPGPKKKAPETLGLGIRTAHEKGLSVVAGHMNDWRDQAQVDEIRRLLDETGIELELGFHYNYCSDEPDIHSIKRDEFAETLKISEMLLSDPEDLIHKAVGWMLREVGNRHLPTEENFLKTRYQNMPRTMLRYAIEKFSESKRQRYLKGKI